MQREISDQDELDEEEDLEEDEEDLVDSIDALLLQEDSVTLLDPTEWDTTSTSDTTNDTFDLARDLDSTEQISTTALNETDLSADSAGEASQTPDRAQPIAKDRQDDQSPYDLYWKERKKLIKHLENRARKFDKKNKEEYDRARWGKSKPRRKNTAKAPSQVSAPTTHTVVASTHLPTENKDNSSNMIGSTSLAARNLARIGACAASSQSLLRPIVNTAARDFSSTASVAGRPPRRFRKLKQKGKRKEIRPELVELPEALGVLRAIELENPGATVNLTLDLRSKNEKDNARNSSLRGRVSLAADPRKTVDVVLVFAEPGSESEKLAKAEKVAYVGASDLFEQLLEGEIQPTKILSTPGLLPSVTQKLARFLGPKGLMPTVRRGGVGEGQELVERIREAKGAFDWMVNDEGLIKAEIARMSFQPQDIETNARQLIASVREVAQAAQGSGRNASSLDNALITRKQAKKKATSGITHILLGSSKGPSIHIKDA